MPSLIQKLDQLRPELAAAAQEVLDEWVQDEEGFDEDLGGGGPCDRVSEAMSGVIGNALDGIEILDGGQDGDDHAWLIVVSDSEAAGVDIPPNVYETGGGYNWKKIPDAQVDSSDVAIWKIDRRDVVASARQAAKYSYEGQFVFQGRTYDMKVRSDGQGAVVYQKSPKCLFARDGDEWLFQAGSKAVYDAAMKHLKREKTAADPDDLRLQEGTAFHLQPDGTWAVESAPPSVAQDARFSGFLAIEGYWCAVFELNGEEWAQKAAGEIPMAKLSAIARRVAEVHTGETAMDRFERIASRIVGAKTRIAGLHGIEVEEFNLVEYSDDPTDDTYPYGIIAGEFVFRMPSGKVIRIRGRSDSQNQGFNVDVDGKPFVVDQSTAPDGMIHFHDLDPDWPDDGLQVDDLIHEIAQSQRTP